MRCDARSAARANVYRRPAAIPFPWISPTQILMSRPSIPRIAQKTHPALAQAVALYTGPLLEGCAEEWVFQERRVREEYCLQALQTLAEAALTTGEYPVAADYYRRAVDLDPWREEARRGLMKALKYAGDSNAALQVYRDFAQMLRKESQAIPDRETRDLYDRLRSEAKRGW